MVRRAYGSQVSRAASARTHRAISLATNFHFFVYVSINWSFYILNYCQEVLANFYDFPVLGGWLDYFSSHLLV